MATIAEWDLEADRKRAANDRTERLVYFAGLVAGALAWRLAGVWVGVTVTVAAEIVASIVIERRGAG